MTPLLLFLQEVRWKGIKSLETGVDITLVVMALLVAWIAVWKLFVFRRAQRIGNQFVEEVKPKLSLTRRRLRTHPHGRAIIRATSLRENC